MTRRGIVAGSLASIATPVSAAGKFAKFKLHGGQPSGFFQAKIGGGGSVTGLDIHWDSIGNTSDGTMLAWCDTFGVYVGNTTPGTAWKMVLTPNSMNGANGITIGYTPATTGTGNTLLTSSFGGGERGGGPGCIAPTNSSVMLVYVNGYWLMTKDKGNTWVSMAKGSNPIPRDNPGSAGGGVWQLGYSKCNGHVAIDPRNQDVAIACGFDTQMYRTTNLVSGYPTPTWTAITTGAGGVPLPPHDGGNAFIGINGVIFDYTSAADGSGNTSIVYAFSTNSGLYRSADNGQTWTLCTTTGGPQQLCHAALLNGSSPAGYACTGDTTFFGSVAPSPGKVFSYTGGNSGTWSSVTSGAGSSFGFAVFPGNNNKAVVADFDSGDLTASSTGSTGTYSGTIAGKTINSSTIPWLAAIGGEEPGLPNHLQFDPTNSGRLWMAEGTGVCYTDYMKGSSFSSGDTVTWNVQTAGIEQMVMNTVLSPPVPSSPICSLDDQVGFVLDPNNAVYPGATNGTTPEKVRPFVFAHGNSVDYAKDSPSTIVLCAYDNATGTGAQVSVSTDKGATWSKLTNQPPGLGTFDTIAVRTAMNWVCTSGQYTTDGATTWNAITTPPGGSIGSSPPISDGTGANFYEFRNDTGCWKSPTGNVWTQVQVNPAPQSSGTLMTAMVPNNDSQNQVFLSPQGTTDLYWCLGTFTQTVGATNLATNRGLWKSTDGGAHWATVSGVDQCFCFGFGAIYPGQAYPTIWVIGWITVGVNPTKYGIWRSKDGGATWQWFIDYPFGWADLPVWITGDQNDAKKCWFAFEGSSMGVGQGLT